MWPHCNQRKSELSLSLYLAICNSCYPCEITAHVLTEAQAQGKKYKKSGKNSCDIIYSHQTEQAEQKDST